MIYVLLVTYPYEGSEIFGVYSSKDIAEEYKKIALKSDKSDGYNDYDVEEFEIDAPLKKVAT